MTDHKFFSGLSDKMMRRKNQIPDRQETHFYWPNETDTEEFTPSSRNRLRDRSASNASLMSQSQASTDTEESKRRKSQQNKSTIEFYDMVDVGTDTESVYSSRIDPAKRLETLKSRIEFYDFVDTRHYYPDDDVESVIERPVQRKLEPSVEQNIKVTSENGHQVEEKPKAQDRNEQQSQNESARVLTQSIQNLSLSPEPKNGHSPKAIPFENSRKKVPQYADSYSESDEDDRSYYRSRNHLEERKYLPPQQHRYPPSQRSIRSHPRRVNSEYFDFDDDEYDRHYDSNRRLKYRKPENIPRMARRRDYSPEVSDEDFYDNMDGSYRRRSEYLRAKPPQPERYRSNASRLDETESYYKGRTNRRQGNGFGSEMDYERKTSPPVRQTPPTSPQNQNIQNEAPANGYANEIEPPRMPAAARPPVKPLARTDSMSASRQRHQVNLRSNIFHNDPDYNVIVEHRKPVSVRDFAGRQRVGVGLPDI